MALWDSPRQREAYDWFTAELANLRTAFRWAADQGDLDVAATIATYAGFLGYRVEMYEPIAWAEELIEPARAVEHPRLAALYVMASLCWMAGRIEAAVGYSEAGQTVLGSGRNEVLYGFEGLLGGVYLAIGQPERAVELFRAQLASGRDTNALTRAALVLALKLAGCADEAMAAANGLIDAAEATHNPFVLSFALFAYGIAFRDADPVRARGCPAPGPGDRPRQRQPRQRDPPGGQSGPTRSRTRRSAGRARLLSLWRSATTTTQATPSTMRAALAVLAAFWIGSDAMKRRPP